METVERLNAWVSQQLGGQQIGLEALSGDAGFRRYFRVTGSAQAVMAVYAPPATENTPLYLAVSSLLATGDVRVPQVLAVDPAQGFLVVEDCGDQLMLPLLDDSSVDRLYGEAMDMLVAIQAIAVPANTIGVYDQQRLWDEMALFPRWFVQDLLDLPFGRNEQVLLENLFEQLVDSALEQPQVLVHRDFHSRNLMLKGDELVTIDFQDAVTGPFTYDLVSLLRDCYIRWQPARVEKYALAYRKSLMDKGKLAGDSDQQFLRWFDLMGLQRHIKVLGIFARLWLRDGKAGYLNDLPLVLQYTMEVASRYPEAADFVDWMQVRVLPACQRQPWWKPLS
jgi:hypothetical protein